MRSRYALALGIDGSTAAACLTAAERRACAALPGAARRRDWRAGRLAAKRAIARALDLVDLGAIELDAVPGAAPLVRVRGLPGASVTVSLAHSGGRAAAVAMRLAARAGIDLETATVRPAHAGYFLTRAERLLVRRRGATALWVLKEAAWKALGLAGSVPFTALELHVGRDSALDAVSVSGERRAASGRVAHPWPGYVLGVVLLPGAAA